MKQNFKGNKQNRTGKTKRFQPRKDNSSKRINADNERIDKLPKDVKKYFERSDSNDINWYTKNKSLFEASTRITWATIQGLTKPFPDSTDVQHIPGAVMAIYYTPNFINNQPIVQQAWISQYSEIVHANSRNQTYDATDLAMLSYAGIEVFAAIMHGIRAYGVMRDYTAESYLKPERFITAMHFDYADLKKNYSHMWQDIDQLIVQSRQIWIPNKMPIIQRRLWMNSYIYTDADNSHGDYYMYVPATFYKYNSKLTSTGGGLEAVREWNAVSSVSSGSSQGINVNGLSWQSYVDMVQSMIDSLLPDQDRGIIYGDILKCYGREGIFALNQIDLSYSTIPQYNKEVLWQIENSTAVNAFPVTLEQTAEGEFETKWNAIVLPRFGYRNVNEFVMNFHQQESPTTEQIAIATRMMAGGRKEVDRYVWGGSNWIKASQPATDLKVQIPTCAGTEFPVYYAIFSNQIKPDGKVEKVYQYVGSFLSFAATADSNKQELLTLIYKLSRLDWAPLMYDGIGDVSTFKCTNVLGELDNWSPVNLDTINRVHIALTNSLYDVPSM